MKKRTLLVAAACMIGVTLFAENSQYLTKVLEYVPAPGQFINTVTSAYASGNSSSEILATAQSNLEGKTSGMVTLGAFGGYITVGFDHTILNSKGNYDFKVYGNGFLDSSEPGIVEVSIDRNKNGVADDEWFELAGSEYQKATTVRNYAVTYYRPESATDAVKWTDNLGNSGEVAHNSFHSQVYYPLWIATDTYTLKGTKIANNDSVVGTYHYLKSYAYGYADNQSNTSDLSNMKIDWAVDSLGRPVHLSGIDFVRVHTGVQQMAGWLGETSTEFNGVQDLHPSNVEPYVGDNNQVLDLSSVSLDSKGVWSDALAESAKISAAPYVFSHTATPAYNSYDGFIATSNADNANYGNNWYASNPYGSMTQGGYDKTGAPCLLAYYNTYSDKSLTVSFSDGNKHNMVGAYITATPQSYYSHFTTNNYTRRFTKGDSFKLTAHGMKNGVETGTVDMYLADFTASDSTQWYANRTWEWMDLSSLTAVDSIYFTMYSTDMGTYGINTATYFCMDKLTSTVATSTGACNIVTRSTLNAYAQGKTIFVVASTPDLIRLYDLSGHLLASNNAASSEFAVPTSGVYIVKVGAATRKVVVR